MTVLACITAISRTTYLNQIGALSGARFIISTFSIPYLSYLSLNKYEAVKFSIRFSSESPTHGWQRLYRALFALHIIFIVVCDIPILLMPKHLCKSDVRANLFLFFKVY